MFENNTNNNEMENEYIDRSSEQPMTGAAPEVAPEPVIESAEESGPEASGEPTAVPHTQAVPVQPGVCVEPSYREIVSEPDIPKKKSRTGLKIAAIAVVCALAGSIGGGALAGKLVSDRLTAEKPDAQIAQAVDESAVSGSDESVSDVAVAAPITVTSNDSSITMTPADIYEKYASAVVGINCETATNVFGQVSTTASSGSGFIITADGYVVTNCHVVEDANVITVMLKDETSYPAELVGYDDENDVALLKIEATGLPTVAIGNSDDLKVGEQVVAIGNPLGELTHTLTVGYVSSLDREINTDGNPINMLQTDAAINSGNSGGPLFDSNGNVIGITTAKYASSTVEGLGFAIPINDAMNIVYSLQQYGYVKGKPSFGIEVGTLNLSYASYYGMPVGCVINSVNSGSCAETAGMQAGDIITRLGDVDIKSVTELSAELKNYKAGDTIQVTLYRQTEYITLSVILDEKLPDYMLEDDSETETQQQQQQSQSGYFNPYSFFFGSGSNSSGSYSSSSYKGPAA